MSPHPNLMNSAIINFTSYSIQDLTEAFIFLISPTLRSGKIILNFSVSIPLKESEKSLAFHLQNFYNQGLIL